MRTRNDDTVEGWTRFDTMDVHPSLLDHAEAFLGAVEAHYLGDLDRPPTYREVMWAISTQLRVRSLLPGRRLKEPWETN